MVRQRNLTFNQRLQQIENNANREQSLFDVANTIYNIVTNTPGEPTPIPISHPVQPFGENVPIYIDDPNTPAEPRDCDAYPDSPWCGGNPFNNRFIDLEPEIIADGCNLGIRLNPTFGFVRMPPINFVYRNPACREPDPPPPEEIFPDYDPPSEFIKLPPTHAGCLYLAKVTGTLDGSFKRPASDDGEWVSYYGEDTFVYTGAHPLFLYTEVRYKLLLGPVIGIEIRDGNTPDNMGIGSGSGVAYFLCAGEINIYDDLNIVNHRPPMYLPYTNGRIRRSTESYQGWSEIHYTVSNKHVPSKVLLSRFGPQNTFRRGFKLDWFEEYRPDLCNPLNTAPPPPRDPPMSCCPDDLIRLLIQKVDRLSEVVGIDQYPATVPESFISTRDGFLNQLVPPSTTEVTNLTRFLEQYVNCFKELMGQWQVEIIAENSNLIDAENLETNLPTVSEAITKMMLLLMQTSTNANLIGSINNQITSLSTKATTQVEIPQQEYLHNQLVSLLAKTATVQTDTPQQEYLHNQLVSLSTKTVTIQAETPQQEYLHNQLVSLSAKTATAQADTPQQEYLHNQLVSLSTKTATAQTETPQQEYLHNQLVSLSIKTATTQAESLQQEYLHNQLVSLSTKTATAQTETPQQEYLHNQLVSLSAKAVVTQADTPQQEYLYNQLVSLSAKAVVTQADTPQQEYLHNQLVSLLAKTVVTQAKTAQQEYLHNQLVSLSIKTVTTHSDTSQQEYLHNQLVSLAVKVNANDEISSYLYNQLISSSAKINTISSSITTEYLSNKLVSLLAKHNTSNEGIGIEYLYNQSISLSVKRHSANISKLLEIAGIDDFPVTVPETLISKFADNSTNTIPINEKQLTSIPQMLHWSVERFDEVMGQWSVPIEIKDIDPTKPGDQTKLMVFPNMAELLAEAMMILLQISINSELLTNLTTRILMEEGQDKQQNLITFKLLQSLTDYIGYSYKDEIIEMPLLFDPKAKTFDQMLKEIQVKVPVPEFDEKFNLQADLMRFRKAASILDSVYFRKVDPNGDIKAQLMKRLFDLRDLLKEANKEDESFKEFLKQVEAGLTGTPGVGDPTKPYGNDYEDRPRFKDFKSDGTIDNI